MLEPRRGKSKLFFLALLLLLALVSGAYADQACELCHGVNGPHAPQCGDTTTCGVSCHQGKLEYIMHPSGAGTPMSNVTSTAGIASSCSTCHQLPATMHPFRINTIPGTVSAYPNLDQVCGQCHGGGTNGVVNPPVTGVVYLTANQLAVVAPNIHSGATTTLLNSVDCILCHNGAPIAPTIVSHPTDSGTPGTGAAACRSCHLANGTLHQQTAVSADKVCGQCHGGSLGTGAAVSPAPYFTETQAAEAAKTMHGSNVSTTDCTVCHNASSTPAISQGTNHHSGACTTCHATATYPLHQGMAVDCTACHNGTEASSITVYHPGGNAVLGSTETARCKTCHESSSVISSITYTNYAGTMPNVDVACGQCHGGSGTTATKYGAIYHDLTFLISAAAVIHIISPTAAFSWTTDAATDYNVLYDASASTCPSGATCTYTWSSGETGVTASHLFSDATTTTVTLMITSSNGGSDSISASVTPKYVAATPTALSLTGNSVSGNTATVNYSLSGGMAPYTVKAVWGDGATVTTPGVAAGANSLSHSFASPGTYTVVITAQDSGVNGGYVTSNSKSTSVTIASSTLTISGTVTRLGGVTPVSSASVMLKLNGVVKKLVYTNAGGNFTMTGVAPGTYTVTVAKSGLIFANPAATVTVTSSNVTGVNISSTN